MKLSNQLLTLIISMLVLLCVAAPTHATLVGGHEHCKTTTWSQTFNLGVVVDTRNVGNQTISPGNIESSDNCHYEISDVASMTYKVTFDDALVAVLVPKITWAARESLQAANFEFAKDVTSGGSVTFSLIAHETFTFNAMVQTFIDLSMEDSPPQVCSDLGCENNVEFTGFKSFDVTIAGTHYYVSEPASLALLGLGLAGIGLARRRKA